MAGRATDMLARELQTVLGNMKQDFDRVEILAAALAAFNRPVPDYEPTFQHLGQAALRDHDLDTVMRGNERSL